MPADGPEISQGTAREGVRSISASRPGGGLIFKVVCEMLGQTPKKQSVEGHIAKWAIASYLKGIPVCLNTSLNRPGEPICEKPDDAINYALNSKADYLVIENFLVNLTKN